MLSSLSSQTVTRAEEAWTWLCNRVPRWASARPDTASDSAASDAAADAKAATRISEEREYAERHGVTGISDTLQEIDKATVAGVSLLQRLAAIAAAPTVVVVGCDTMEIKVEAPDLNLVHLVFQLITTGSGR